MRFLIAFAMWAALMPLRPAAAADRVSTVRFSSADDFRLSARYYDPGVPGPAAILFHQCDRRGDDTGLEPLASKLARRGFHVLLPDGRGFGESRNERYHDFHSQMDLIEPLVQDDMKAAYQFIASMKGVDARRISLAGASCGARRLVRLVESGAAQATALILLSGALRTDEASFSKAREIPLYAVFAEEDPFRAPAAMREAFARSTSRSSKLQAYKGSAHGAPLFEQDKHLAEDIAAWLVDQVQGRPHSK